jgi:hypothetical protein
MPVSSECGQLMPQWGLTLFERSIPTVARFENGRYSPISVAFQFPAAK